MCDSTYTIDFRTGEKLTCIRELARKHIHIAEYGTNSFYWRDSEADERNSET